MKKNRMSLWACRRVTFFLLLLLGACGLGITQAGWDVQPAQAAPSRQGSDPYQVCDLIRGFVDNISPDGSYECSGYTGEGENDINYVILAAFLHQTPDEARDNVTGYSYASESLGRLIQKAPLQVGDYGEEYTKYTGSRGSYLDVISYDISFALSLHFKNFIEPIGSRSDQRKARHGSQSR